MKIYKELTKICNDLGLKEFSVTHALPFENLETHLQNSKDSLSGFLSDDIKKRIDPQIIMSDAKSIICILFPYKIIDSHIANEFLDSESIYSKIVSGDTHFGKDYHIYCLEKLDQICISLRSTFGGNFLPYCDTGPLVDKAVAVRSGLCKYGKNSVTINKDYGSFFYIGNIITSLDIHSETTNHSDDSNIVSELCENCDKCIKACPTGSISNGKLLDYKKCISYISQKPGQLSKSEMAHIKNTIYGCHICQDVCPANSHLGRSFTAYVDIEKHLEISNKQFKLLFSSTNAGWIGKNSFTRNLLISVCNSNSKNAKSILEKYINSDNEVISLTAKTALEMQQSEGAQ